MIRVCQGQSQLTLKQSRGLPDEGVNHSEPRTAENCLRLLFAKTCTEWVWSVSNDGIVAGKDGTRTRVQTLNTHRPSVDQ